MARWCVHAATCDSENAYDQPAALLVGDVRLHVEHPLPQSKQCCRQSRRIALTDLKPAKTQL